MEQLSEPPVNCRMILAGSAALSRLEEHSFTCLAAFSRSLYLKTKTGKLICLLTQELEPGPLNALCAPWPAEAYLPAPGSRVQCLGDTLHWPGVSIFLQEVALWQPPAPPPETVPEALVPLEVFLKETAARAATDFSPLFAHFLAGADLPDASSPLLAAGADALTPLALWLRALDSLPPGKPLPPPAISGLLGLGPGLTPSGDDILGGAMIALRLTGRDREAAALYDAIRALPGRTNAISLAHLELAAAGQGAEALHLLLLSLFTGVFSGEAAERLNGVGHSSGWDMALGAALALYLPGSRP